MPILHPLVRSLLSALTDTPLAWIVHSVETRIDNEPDRPQGVAETSFVGAWQLRIAETVVSEILKREIRLWEANTRLAGELAIPIVSITIASPEDPEGLQREDLLSPTRLELLNGVLKWWTTGVAEVRSTLEGPSFEP